eukprot:6480859-Amphidinium_carterae.1
MLKKSFGRWIARRSGGKREEASHVYWSSRWHVSTVMLKLRQEELLYSIQDCGIVCVCACARRSCNDAPVWEVNRPLKHHDLSSNKWIYNLLWSDPVDEDKGCFKFRFGLCSKYYKGQVQKGQEQEPLRVLSKVQGIEVIAVGLFAEAPRSDTLYSKETRQS